MAQKETLAILVGGGPAPGINGVIAAATIEAINSGPLPARRSSPNRDEATVKKYYPGENGTVRLQPANPTMEPIFVNADDLRIRGVVVGLMRHYR